MKKYVEDKTNDTMISHNKQMMLNQMLHQANNESIDESAKIMLENDPSIYQYDELYDDMQKTRQTIQQKKKEEKKQKKESIIGNIRASKFRRDRETSISIEALALKERERSGIKDEEKFVTSSYLKVLEENKKFQEEQMKRDQQIANSAIGGNSNKTMQDFEKGLFNQGFFKGGNRIDLNEEKKKLEQEQKIQKYLEIKNARLQKRDAHDEILKKDILEQYNIPKSKDINQSQNQQQNDKESYQKPSRKSRSKSKSQEHKKHKSKKHKKHRSRSRSHHKSKKRSRSHHKSKKRSRSHEKNKKRSSKSKSPQQKQQQQKQEEEQSKQPQLTPQEKKALALEKYKQRKLQMEQEKLQQLNQEEQQN